MERLTENLKAHQGVIAFSILAAAVVVSLYIASNISDRLEEESIARATETCEVQNNTLEVIELILDEVEEEAERTESRTLSQEFRDRVDPMLDRSDCPPEPPERQNRDRQGEITD